MLAARAKKIELVLELKVDDKVLLQRVEQRIKEGGILPLRRHAGNAGAPPGGLLQEYRAAARLLRQAGQGRDRRRHAADRRGDQGHRRRARRQVALIRRCLAAQPGSRCSAVRGVARRRRAVAERAARCRRPGPTPRATGSRCHPDRARRRSGVRQGPMAWRTRRPASRTGPRPASHVGTLSMQYTARRHPASGRDPQARPRQHRRPVRARRSRRHGAGPSGDPSGGAGRGRRLRIAGAGGRGSDRQILRRGRGHGGPSPRSG